MIDGARIRPPVIPILTDPGVYWVEHGYGVEFLRHADAATEKLASRKYSIRDGCAIVIYPIYMYCMYR